MSAVSVETVSRTMEALLAREGRSIVYRDRATGAGPRCQPAERRLPAGLLPAFVVAGEAVWREATGKGFALDIVRDPQALLGYRLRGIGAGSFRDGDARDDGGDGAGRRASRRSWSTSSMRCGPPPPIASSAETRLSPRAGAGAAP